MEVIGTVASVVTLVQLINKLSKYANAYRNAGNEVERCRDVLLGIVHSIEIIHALSSGPEAPVLVVPIEGQAQNVIGVCSEKIESIIKDVKKLLDKFAIARSKRKILNNLAAKLRSGSKPNDTKVKPQHISNLVQTAKDLEGSLHFAMSTLIYAKMGASHRDWQQTFQGLIDRFEQSQQTWRAETSPIGVYTTMEAEDSTTSQPLQDVSERERGSDHEASRNSSGTLILINESSDMSEGLGNEIEIVAELFDDGRLVPCPYYNADEVHDTAHAETTSESETGDTDTPIEIETDVLTDELQASDLGEQCTGFSDETTEISRSGSVFLDAATNIASCKSLDTNAFHFCIHTLSVQDDGQFTAMLREPCSLTGAPCDHISMHWRRDSLHTIRLPAMFDVTVRHGQILPNADFNEQVERADAPILYYSPSCLDKDMHTLIYMLQGARNRYAAPNSITIVQSWPANSKDEDPAEEEELNGNNDEATTELRGDNEESQDEGDRNAVKCGIRDYTVVPCFFCGSDALQPAVSAQGAWEVFIYRNHSIGYNCSRCEKRTWVSGGEFTLTLAGGNWTTWSVRG